MGPSLLHPARLTRSALGGLDRATSLLATGAALPSRVVGLVNGAEDLLGQARTALESVTATITEAAESVERVRAILDRTEATVARTDTLLDSTDSVVTRTRGLLANADAITTDAGGTLRTARELTDEAQGLLGNMEPTLEKALPLLEKFANSLSPAEVDAAIKLVDELPVLTESLRTDILPILATLDRVGPDINELLHVMDDVRHAIIGIPGFSFFKKRGTGLIEDDEDFELHPHDDDVPHRAPVSRRPSESPAADSTPLAVAAAAAHRP